MKQAIVYRIIDGQREDIRTYTEEQLEGAPITDPKEAAAAFMTGRTGLQVELVGYGKPKAGAKANEGGEGEGEGEGEEGGDTVASYSELSLKDLKAECKTRGIEVPAGAKSADLVALLEANDASK